MEIKNIRFDKSPPLFVKNELSLALGESWGDLAYLNGWSVGKVEQHKELYNTNVKRAEYFFYWLQDQSPSVSQVITQLKSMDNARFKRTVKRLEEKFGSTEEKENPVCEEQKHENEESITFNRIEIHYIYKLLAPELYKKWIDLAKKLGWTSSQIDVHKSYYATPTQRTKKYLYERRDQKKQVSEFVVKLNEIGCSNIAAWLTMRVLSIQDPENVPFVGEDIEFFLSKREKKEKKKKKQSVQHVATEPKPDLKGGLTFYQKMGLDPISESKRLQEKYKRTKGYTGFAKVPYNFETNPLGPKSGVISNLGYTAGPLKYRPTQSIRSECLGNKNMPLAPSRKSESMQVTSTQQVPVDRQSKNVSEPMIIVEEGPFIKTFDQMTHADSLKCLAMFLNSKWVELAYLYGWSVVQVKDFRQQHKTDVDQALYFLSYLQDKKASVPVLLRRLRNNDVAKNIIAIKIEQYDPDVYDPEI